VGGRSYIGGSRWSVHVCDLQTLKATMGLGQMPVGPMEMWLVWRRSLVGLASRASLQPAAAHQPHLVHHLGWPRAVFIFQPAPDCIRSTHRITMARIHLALLLAILATIASACESIPVPAPLADPHPDHSTPTLSISTESSRSNPGQITS
jgi:hypothetical protein